MEEKEKEIPTPWYWTWGTPKVWSLVIKFRSSCTVANGSITVNLEGINYTMKLPKKWNPTPGKDYIFSVSARTDRQGRISKLIPMPYGPSQVENGIRSPTFRLVGKLKYQEQGVMGFRVYRNPRTPRLKKKFMIHLTNVAADKVDMQAEDVCEIYGKIEGNQLIPLEITGPIEAPPMHEIQEVKFKPRPKPGGFKKNAPGGRRVRV